MTDPASPTRLHLRRLCRASLLFSLALVLSYLENFLPQIIPGLPFRWGLSNIVVMFAMLYLSPPAALMIACGKALFNLSWSPLTALFSLSGGLCSILILFLLRRSRLSLISLSVLSALGHNFAQILLSLCVLPLGSFTYLFLPLFLLSLLCGTASACLLRLCVRNLSRAGLCLFLPLLLLFPSCRNTPPSMLEKNYFDFFDTLSVLRIPGDTEGGSALLDELHKQFLHQDDLFSSFKDVPGLNNVFAINRAAGKQPLAVEDQLFELISRAKELGEASNDAFQPLIGAATVLWQQPFEQAQNGETPSSVPSEEELRSALAKTELRKIRLNEREKTVFLEEEGMRLDLGAIAKGFAAEKAAQFLKEKGVRSALINLGGNVRCLGARPDGQPFRVGINNPYLRLCQSTDLRSEEASSLHRLSPAYASFLDERAKKEQTAPSFSSEVNSDVPPPSAANPPGSAAAVGEEPPLCLDQMEVVDASAVSSGIYERFFFFGGKRFSHILDSRTGQPASRYVALTILLRDSCLADGLSTALFNLSPGEGKNLLKKLAPEAEVVWYFSDGSREYFQPEKIESLRPQP